VSFTDQSTGDPTQWSWDFGDGGTSTAKNPSHTYDEPGTYTVRLTATNSAGSDTATRSGYITVTDGGGGPPPPGNYVDSVTGDNPAGYWRMGGTGTTVTATVGSNGTANGGVTSVAGNIGSDGARGFDGSTGYVSVPSSAALNTTGDLAIEAWARPAAATGGVVVQKGGASGYSVWQYRLAITSGGQWRGTVFVGSTAYAVTAPGSAALNQWSHLALVRSGSSLSIYVNGQLAATANAPGTLNSTTGMFAIGRSGASSSSYFNGAVDEVAFYNHTISAASISARASEGGG
jgi:PKD repeat protein